MSERVDNVFGRLASVRNPLALALLELILLPLIACDPFHTNFEDNEPVMLYRALNEARPQRASPGGELKVMTWNIKFGGGRIDFFFDCYDDRVLMREREVIENLDQLAAKIREINPDVLLLQEVDRASKRSAFIDQVQYLLDHTDLNWGAYASHWKADYIPSDGLGAMDSGNAILSRYPFEEARRDPLPLVGEQDALTRYFYLRRNLLQVKLDIPTTRPVWVINTHLSAYSKDSTKRDQIDLFKEMMEDYDKKGVSVVGGGDFNALPPRSEKLADFPDVVCEDEDFDFNDYSPEVGWLDATYEAFTPAVSLDDYEADNSVHFTHTVNKDGFWNRKLDYLFTNESWREGSTITYLDERHGLPTMPLSDHAPISSILELP